MSRSRKTTQRTIIRQVIRRAGRPLSAGEMAGLARADAPRLGTATVYRAIHDFVEEGWIVPVEIPSEPTRYELSGLRHHHHFYCRACRKVFDVPGCPSNVDALTPQGFQLDAHEVILYGRCNACAA